MGGGHLVKYRGGGGHHFRFAMKLRSFVTANLKVFRLILMQIQEPISTLHATW